MSSNSIRRENAIAIVRDTFAAVAMGGMVSVAFIATESGRAHEAQINDQGKLRTAGIEKAFWVCDYVATAKGVHFTPIHHCAAITEELKLIKFRGDYEEMVDWWRQNKALEHWKLEVQERQCASAITYSDELKDLGGWKSLVMVDDVKRPLVPSSREVTTRRGH